MISGLKQIRKCPFLVYVRTQGHVQYTLFNFQQPEGHFTLLSYENTLPGTLCSEE